MMQWQNYNNLIENAHKSYYKLLPLSPLLRSVFSLKLISAEHDRG